MKGQRPFAVFDIDGTLLRWQLYHATVDALAKAGKIDADKFAGARAARMVWKNRASDSSFKEYEKALVNMYDQAVQNISYDDYLAAVKRVFEEYKGQTYTYTRDLIRELKAKNYILFAISASQIEAVELLAKHYGFDDFAGSKYELKNGKFTGQKDVMFGGKKPLALEKLVKKHNASFRSSLAVGDSDSDIAMLEKVENPIAFNPNKLLFQKASASGWPIVIERKNMVYKLEASASGYGLVDSVGGK